MGGRRRRGRRIWKGIGGGGEGMGANERKWGNEEGKGIKRGDKGEEEERWKR